MNITSAKYYTHPSAEGNQGIEIVSDEITMHVPIDTDNTDYQAILEWAKEDGNEIAEAD
tara:strand:- start:231 stop:407 length:177 start_codon:yes stop_codon:yes gene_type:complete